MDNQEYRDMISNELVVELTANSRIKNFTTNTALIGGFAEATVIDLIKKVVFPLRVSTGSVISKKLLESGKKLPQIDCIIRNPAPFPALFEKGDFGIIPKQSVLGVLEVKSSNYSGVGDKIQEVLEKEKDLVTPGILVTPGAISKFTNDSFLSTAGIIPLYNTNGSDKKLNDLVTDGRVFTLLEYDGNLENLKPSRSGVLKLMNFLKDLRKRSMIIDGTRGVDIDYISTS